jgi:hypothetical protein
MLDAGVDLRDAQIAARHADPRTTMRYDRARTNLDRHPSYILAAYMSSGTYRSTELRNSGRRLRLPPRTTRVQEVWPAQYGRGHVLG